MQVTKTVKVETLTKSLRKRVVERRVSAHIYLSSLVLMLGAELDQVRERLQDELVLGLPLHRRGCDVLP